MTASPPSSSILSIPLSHADDIFSSLRSTGAISPHFQLLGALQQLDHFLEEQKKEQEQRDEAEKERQNALYFGGDAKARIEHEKKMKKQEQDREKQYRKLQSSSTHTTDLRWIFDARNTSPQVGTTRNVSAVMTICISPTTNNSKLEELTKALQVLLERGASPNLRDSIDYRGFTPLFQIIYMIPAVSNNTNPNNNNAIHNFAKEPQARLLLEHGARVDAKSNSSSYFARTALHHAAERGNLGAICLLLEFGADLWIQDTTGMTPLMLALNASRSDAAANLFEAMRGQCLEKIQEKYETPHHQAIFSQGSKDERVRALRQQIQDEADNLCLDKIMATKNKAQQTAFDIAYSKRTRNPTNNSANRPQFAFAFIIDFYEKCIEDFRGKLIKEEMEKKNKKEKDHQKEEEQESFFAKAMSFFGQKSSKLSAAASDQQNNNNDSSTEITPKIREEIEKKVQAKFPQDDRNAGTQPQMLPVHLQATHFRCFVNVITDWRSSLPWLSSFGVWIAYIILRNNLSRRGLLPERWFSK